MYFQQPWWSEYKGFVDAMPREGMVLTESKKYADVLVIHPQTTAWSLYDGKPAEEAKYDEIEKVNNELLSLMKTLEQKHIMYHLGDETVMERHAKVENGKLVIGDQSYSYIIDTACGILLQNTKELIDEFKAQGGKIVNADELLENPVCDNGEITYVKRVNDKYTVHYFVNTSSDRKNANINVTGKKLDIYTGDLVSFEEYYEFEPWGSLMIIEDETKPSEKQNQNIIKLSGEFDILKPVQNAITLDFCDYYFEVKVNRKVISKTDCGYYIDKSFRKIDISEYIQIGENTISFDCDFKQSDEFYKNRRKSFVFETEKNKLVYDMEIEAVYLLGDFSVKTDGKWEQLDRNAVRYFGSFEMDPPKNKISLQNIEQQGFPFFSGEM